MTFKQWADAGFDVIPVVPPGARISPMSKLHAAEAGKIPGRLNPYGFWTGLQGWATVPVDAALWDTWGASIGLRTKNFPAIDIDVMDEGLADEISRIAFSVLGSAPTRVGRAPKRTHLYRTDAPFKRMRLRFQREGEAAHLVEVLGDGQQFVVDGIHPGTGKPFGWDRRPDGPTDLTTTDAERAEAFLDDVATLVTALGYTVTRQGAARASGSPPPVQTELAGDLEQIREAVGLLPNTSALFPERDDYLKVGYAIRAALPEHPTEAFDLWWGWCQKWEGNENGPNDPERARQDWRRMSPPFLVGAPWLLDLARNHGFSNAQDEFNDGAVFRERPSVPPAEAPNKSGAIRFSDAWHAERFIVEHGSTVRHCERLGGWLEWDGHRWAADASGAIVDRMGAVLRAAGRHAAETLDNPVEAKSTAKFCASEKARRNTLAYAAVDRRLAVDISAFDTDPWALNTPAGIVNLRTGELHAPDPSRLFTRCTAVAPTGSPERGFPRWAAFLEEVTQGDADLQSYLRRLAGYALTGSTREHVLAFLWGPGGNGKGVFLNTLVRLAGSYASVAAMDTFTSSRFDRHPTELASLFGARLVTAQETQEGRSWDEAKVKSITGGDPITARYMRQDFFTFTPQFKLLFAGNHKPRIHNLDDAMRRRFHLVPFTVIPAVRDMDLAEKLVEEWPSILAWAIEGCLEWQRIGLAPPAVVREATEAYFIDEDPVGRWVSERTLPGPGVETRDVWTDWQIWCAEQNERPGTQRAFVQALITRGFEKWRHPATRRHGFAGVTLQVEMRGIGDPVEAGIEALL